MIPATMIIILTALSASATLIAGIMMFWVMKVEWATKDARLRAFQWLIMMHLIVATLSSVRTVLWAYYYPESVPCMGLSPVLSRTLSAIAVIPYYLYSKSKHKNEQRQKINESRGTASAV